MNAAEKVSAKFHSPSEGAELVVGVSSSGKSHFIKHLLTNVPTYANASPVYQSTLHRKPKMICSQGSLVHLDMTWRDAGVPVFQAPNVDQNNHAVRVLRAGGITKVHVIVCEEAELRRRFARRKSVGIGFGEDSSPRAYDGRYQRGMLNLHALPQFYLAWIEAFEGQGIDCLYYHSFGGQFIPLENKAQALRILARRQWFKAPVRFLRRLKWRLTPRRSL